MLVVISDLHLSDGTLGSTISAGAFQLFGERLAELAASASLRADGNYRPVERIDLVLAGDVLDVIRSTRWLEGTARPWHGADSPAVVDTVSRITGDILRHNAEALGCLRSLAQGAIRLVPASHRGGPADSAESVPVPVRIHYMVGDSDWFFHLSGEAYRRLRRQVATHLGLATDPEHPFPHEQFESRELLDAAGRHSALIRHGDLFDPLSFDGDRDLSSLGDAITVEILNRFPLQLERELGTDLPQATRRELNELDNLRPILMAPVWIDGLVERTCSSPAVRRHVRGIWDWLVDEFLEQPFVRQRDMLRPQELIDGLATALKYSRRPAIGWAEYISQWLNRLRGASGPSYASHALAEAEYRNRRASYVVYGHTHQVEELPLDASHAEGYVLNQAYFNSGTWRRVYQPTLWAPAEHEFVATQRLSFLAFFQGDERGGRPYESWTGTLGVNPNLPPSRPRDETEPATDLASANGLPPVQPPHFAEPATALPLSSAFHATAFSTSDGR